MFSRKTTQQRIYTAIAKTVRANRHGPLFILSRTGTSIQDHWIERVAGDMPASAQVPGHLMDLWKASNRRRVRVSGAFDKEDRLSYLLTFDKSTILFFLLPLYRKNPNSLGFLEFTEPTVHGDEALVFVFGGSPGELNQWAKLFALREEADRWQVVAESNAFDHAKGYYPDDAVALDIE